MLQSITRTNIIRVVTHLGASVEYAIHCLLWLVGREGQPLSSRELATLQGISPSFVAKIFPRLEKAQLVTAAEGVAGGYSLAREPAKITFLDIVDAVEGKKPLFDCQGSGPNAPFLMAARRFGQRAGGAPSTPSC